MASSLVDDSGINLITRLNGLSQIKQEHKYDFASDTSFVNTSWGPSALTSWSLRKLHGQDRKGISAQLELTEKSIENTIRTLVSQLLSELLDEAVYSANSGNPGNPEAPKNPVPAGNSEAPKNPKTPGNPNPSKNPETLKDPVTPKKLDLDLSTLGKMVDSAADGLENLVGSYIRDGDAVKDVNTHIINFRNLASKIRQINNTPKLARSLSHKSVFEHYSSLELDYNSAILHPPPTKEPVKEEPPAKEEKLEEEKPRVLSTSPQVDRPEKPLQPVEEARIISVHTAKEVSPVPPEVLSNPHNLPSLSYLLAQPVVPVAPSVNPPNPPDPPIISDEDDQDSLIRGQIRYSPPHPILNPIFREQPEDDLRTGFGDHLKLKEDDLDDDPTEEYQEDSTDSLDLEEHPDPLTFPRMDYLSAPDGGLTASMLSFLMKEANATSVDVKPEVTETVAEVKQEIVKEPEVKEPEVKEPEIKKEPEVKEPEIKKEPEVKEPEIKKEPKIKMPKPVKLASLKPEIKKIGPPQIGPLKPDVLQKSHKHESKSQTSELRHRPHHSRQKSNVTVHAEIDWSEMKKPRVKKPHDSKGTKKIQVVHQDPFENIIDGFGQFLQALIK